MDGPGDTPFEGGVFPLEVFCPENYPLVPPKVLFRCKIYHPNVNAHGQICLSILKKKEQMKEEDEKLAWSPARRLNQVLLSIQALMSGPNLDDPLDEEINDHYKNDLEAA